MFLVRWRSQLPGWRLATMARLVTAEVEGIRIIEQVLPQVTDAQIRKLLEKHLQDEYRHAKVFSDRYAAMLTESGRPWQSPPEPLPTLQAFNLLSLVAYLETQEARAITLLELYIELYAGDDETVEIIRRNTRDEKFHAAWTRLQLEKWIQEGKTQEVRHARRQALLIDRRGFWMQLLAFAKALPRILSHGAMPPLFRKKPACLD